MLLIARYRLFLPSARSFASASDGADRVQIERKEGGIAVVSLNRPAKKNALDMAMFTGIQEAALQLQSDASVRAVILQGRGSAFSSGLDVKSVSSNPLNMARLLARPDDKLTNLAQDVAWLWRTIPCPVIAVTHRICFGGGFQIALGADFRYETRPIIL